MTDVGRVSPKHTIDIDLGDVAPLKAEITRLTGQRDRLRAAYSTLRKHHKNLTETMPKPYVAFADAAACRRAQLALEDGDVIEGSD